MQIRNLGVVALVVACLLGGCSNAETAKPSTSQPPKPAVMLDGTYRLDFDRAQQTMDGRPLPEEPYARTYAFRSACDADSCTATGVRVNDQNPSQLAGGGTVVLDYIGDEWVRTYNNSQTCRDAQVPVLESWSFKPGGGGSLAGRRRLAFVYSPCTGAYDQPVTVTRTGDVDPAVTVTDPGKVAPLTRSAGARLKGRYNRTITQGATGQKTTIPVKVTTTCVRNFNHCLTYVVTDAADGAPATAEGYQLQDGLWSVDRPFQGTCPDGAPVNGITHIEWTLPDQAADPIPRLTGTQRDAADPCPGTTNADIVLERIGD